MTHTMADTLTDAVAQARERYARARPLTQALHERARQFLPGGNTRSVLYHQPFPLRIASAWDAMLRDVDGHDYVDLLGEYSAGLYGHSNPVVTKAMTDALNEGLSRGAHTRYEVDLAEAVCARFASIERVRFTNSGTEANLMALSAARAYTGREQFVAFRGGYHGGLLTFKGAPSPVNAPYDILMADYNDAGSALAVIGDATAGVLVEPMMGSSGCIPGDRDFLVALREATERAGALLIFDEVMTSRTGAGGLQGRLGITPDLTTLGKYLGGGASFGAFGGRPASWSSSTRDGRTRCRTPARSTTTCCRWRPVTPASPRSTRRRPPSGTPPGATGSARGSPPSSPPPKLRSASPASAACSPFTPRPARSPARPI